ncbi:Lipase [Thalictrum thalictroides]|uniref:Lipase n=1 Tax=Thalictrum thalictroides TaxID=46969 RepID=A0A7J6WKT1_THATH|nr:Lipase [Thalictrum thalictroides]
MVCSSVNISSSATLAKDIFKEHNNILRRSQSSKDLYDGDSMRRSHSEPLLRCSLNPLQATSAEPKLIKNNNSSSLSIFPFQVSGSTQSNSPKSVFETDIDKEMSSFIEHSEESEEEMEILGQEKRTNWMERLLELRSNWRNRKPAKDQSNEGDEDECGDGDEGGCEVEYEVGEEVVYDREMFSKLLAKVPWSVSKLFSQLAFLCNLAYVIPEIKSEDLRKYYDLHFVTSSLEKKAIAALKMKLEQDSTCVPQSSSSLEMKSEKPKTRIRPSVAYKVAAAAASYLHSTAKGLLALGQKSDHEDPQTDASHGSNDRKDPPEKDSGLSPFPSRMYNSEMAAYVATSTMTAVVAAEEAVKQEAAKELQSLDSSPCEWFICDDPSTYTRCFVIQGSDSSASWKANLFFDPTNFEGTDVLVHRGIYEAAKGIYEQFLPEILNHLNMYGDRAKLRFTGHSLGGSLSLLVSLMLLSREIVKPSTLLPVVTFGSPFVFCGGRRILDLLGLDESHIQAVMMHRDIVPRAFSCNYPKHIAQLLKRLNGSFRSHPCLNRYKMLFTPLGQLYILQPDEKSSPPHPLLPAGTALYELDNCQTSCNAGISSALRAFFNSPHPLETLSDPTAYGSEGTILRDHDSSNYLKGVNGVLRQHTKNVVRRTRRERLHHLWPLLTTTQLQSPPSWSHQQKLENFGLAKKEIVRVTGVQTTVI